MTFVGNHYLHVKVLWRKSDSYLLLISLYQCYDWPHGKCELCCSRHIFVLCVCILGALWLYLTLCDSAELMHTDRSLCIHYMLSVKQQAATTIAKDLWPDLGTERIHCNIPHLGERSTPGRTVRWRHVVDTARHIVSKNIVLSGHNSYHL